jgi:flavin-dependent dehydrogenase
VPVSPTDRVDVTVIGAGPAGCAAARLLSMWGYRVAVLPGPQSSRREQAESLPPSCRKPLALLGLLDAVDAAGFLPTRGNASAWESEELRAIPFGEPPGFQVDRRAFDALLLAAAAAAGARVIQDASAREVDADGGLVQWRSPGAAGTLHASWLLDCSGRAGLLARRGSRAPSGGPGTTAIIACWHGSGRGPLRDAGDTLVEALADGWVWSVPIGRDRRHVALMLDPAVTPLRGRDLEQVYREHLARTLHARRLLADGRLGGRPWARAASPYGARCFARAGALLVGDAGSFIDPLSSFGVKKALASGTLAAVVTHSSLAHPDRMPAALELFDRRERLGAYHYDGLSRGFYAAAAERFGTSFWERRASGVGPVPGPVTAAEGAWGESAAGERDPRSDPRLSVALEAIRRAPRLELRPAPGLRRASRPTVRGREVVIEEHLVAPAVPEGVRYFGAVELPRLLDLLCAHEGVPELYESYVRAGSPVPLGEFLGALSALLAYGIVETPVSLPAP